jgi:hypothetical protein
MKTQFAVLVALLILTPKAKPQAGSTAQADHPSNEVLEMALAPVFPQVVGPRQPGSASRLRDDIWDGVLEVTLRNVSDVKVSFIRRSGVAQYDIEVIDAEGKKEDLTPLGKDQLSAAKGTPSYSGPVSIINLDPGQVFSERILLAEKFHFKRGQTYSVKVRRTRDLPQFDQFGRSLAELSVTVVVKGGPGGSDAPLH